MLLPLLLGVGLAVGASLGRPVIFRQRRVGRGMRSFTLYKFRTLPTPGRPGARRPGAAIGRLLRRTRLDELPQLWNVVAGDMALIGPRPLVAEELAGVGDGARGRATVRPGITGWAQVNGGRRLEAGEKVALDLWYVRNRSLLLDLRIALRTVAVIVADDRVNDVALTWARA